MNSLDKILKEVQAWEQEVEELEAQEGFCRMQPEDLKEIPAASGPVTYTAHTQKGMLLNANENPNPMDPLVLQEVLEAVSQMALNRYPEDEAAALRQAYGNWLGVPAEAIIAGAGSDQMLQLLITAFCGPDKRLLTFTPDFGMYDFYASASHAQVLKYPIDLLEGADVEELIQTALETKPDLVLFSNPNNPTGTYLPPEDIRKIAQALAPVPVAVDEAYVEFADGSAISLLDECDNLYITRTLSKAFGLAGMRIGFLISRPENIEKLLPFKIVYNLSSLAQKIGEIVVRNAPVCEEQIEQIKAERTRMKQAIAKLGITCGPAHANYLTIYPKDPAATAQAFEKAGIQVRSYQDQPFIRITVGLPFENDQVLNVLGSL